MTYTINIEQGISMYSSDELINYAHNGCLYANGVCLSELVEKVLARDEALEYANEQEIDVRIENARCDARYTAKSEVIDEIIGYLNNI